MRKLTLSLLILALFCLSAFAVTVPSGTIYFDNTNTGYAQPKFVYGNDNQTIIEEMEKNDGNVWSLVHISSTNKVERYFFTGTSLEEGTYSNSISEVKDYISNDLGEKRTATSKATITAGYIFKPEKADNWNQGTWSKYEEESESSFYIAGNGTTAGGGAWCCGLNWDPAGCQLAKGDSINFTLPSGSYSFKITFGDWKYNWGYPNLDVDGSITCTTDADYNVNFTLTEQHVITVKFDSQEELITVLQDGSSPTPPTPPVGECSPASGTIPVMYLYTDGGEEITSKEDYINAKFYIDASMTPDYKSAGRPDSMLVTQIKGRGNYTWTGFDKKPYRIKLDVKKKLLKLTKDKNYTLLAHADDSDAFLRNTLGFTLSRLLGLDYTPGQEPVELFINDEYKGIYFLTDKIKIGTNRVKITEQPDKATDPSIITGGWLLEIDNYWEDKSIQFQMIEKDNDWLRVTCHSPEDMSTQQYNYMETYLKNTNDAIHNGGWESYIDIDTLVNFYLVQEIMGSHESFHGSCYMHKERGANTKLQFGPVWDFGSALHHTIGLHIYEYPTWGDTWIDDLAEYDSFQEQCEKRWIEVRGGLYPELKKTADAFIEKINYAAACDLKKWPEYGNSKLNTKKNQVLSYLKERMEWLDTYWGTTDVKDYSSDVIGKLVLYPNPTTGRINIDGIENIESLYVTDLSGRVVQRLDASEGSSWTLNVAPGAYIVNVVDGDGNYYNSRVVVR